MQFKGFKAILFLEGTTMDDLILAYGAVNYIYI